MTAARALPRLTSENRFFWTSGRDAVLRFLRCEACQSFVHPPRPICPNCLSEALAPAEVPGSGIVASYTINRQKWHPVLELPYVIARIAIDGAPGVILTSNIVNCEPESVEIGDRVRVVFEQQEDVWFPLFEKTS